MPTANTLWLCYTVTEERAARPGLQYSAFQNRDSLCTLCGISSSLASLCGYAQDGGNVILVKASIKEKKRLSDNIKYSSFRPLGAVILGSRVTRGLIFHTGFASCELL